MKLVANLFLLAVVVLASAIAIGRTQASPPRLRIGTYDNRSIAVAYAPSRFNPIKERMQEYEKAKKAGDEARRKELEAWGAKQQRNLHRQGFARAPVGELLVHVKVGMATVAEKRGLDLITSQCDYVGEGVEVVDVTDDLVLLFDPSEKTIQMAREVRQHEPVDLDEIDRDQEH